LWLGFFAFWLRMTVAVGILRPLGSEWQELNEGGAL